MRCPSGYPERMREHMHPSAGPERTHRHMLDAPERGPKRMHSRSNRYRATGCSSGRLDRSIQQQVHGIGEDKSRWLDKAAACNIMADITRQLRDPQLQNPLKSRSLSI